MSKRATKAGITGVQLAAEAASNCTSSEVGSYPERSAVTVTRELHCKLGGSGPMRNSQ